MTLFEILAIVAIAVLLVVVVVGIPYVLANRANYNDADIHAPGGPYTQAECEERTRQEYYELLAKHKADPTILDDKVAEWEKQRYNHNHEARMIEKYGNEWRTIPVGILEAEALISECIEKGIDSLTDKEKAYHDRILGTIAELIEAGACDTP